jgi:hypothetical protein
MFRALFFVLSALLLIVIAHAEEEESTDVNKKKEELAALRKKAETGGAADWFSLAAALIEEEQHDESRTWLRRASEKGHVESAFLLGEIYREGRSVTADEVEALRLIRFAAEKGLPRAATDCCSTSEMACARTRRRPRNGCARVRTPATSSACSCFPDFEKILTTPCPSNTL